MPDESMTRCETKRLYKTDAGKEWRWIEIAVADIPSGAENLIRCTHCHGAIKLHKEKGETGPPHLAKHKARADADNCKNGRGGSRSSKPIT
jgi:cytochrome c2